MQTKIQQPENDVIYRKNTAFFLSHTPETYYSRINCKILQVTTNAIIYQYQGQKQGIPLRYVECFRYGRT